MCPVAFGSQTGGSTLRPAAYNGIVGFKAEYGRISNYGMVPLSWNQDHVGILARSVKDVSLVFQAIAGYDPNDVHSIDAPIPDCISNLEQANPPRLGLVREYFFSHASEEMRRHTEETATRLSRAGAQITEVKLPKDFETLPDINRLIMAVEAAAYHKEMFNKSKDQYGTHIRSLIEEGLGIKGIDFAKALETRLQFRVELASISRQFDGLVTPGATGAAPLGLDSTGNAAMQRPWTVRLGACGCVDVYSIVRLVEVRLNSSTLRFVSLSSAACAIS
jgi:Asp-tRNA(Asn)/Glu-tRNA(Gln) amidotransferase A subunit family amidase